ncbi:Ribonuclease J 1 [uncultured Clostridium sp.]|nr:Ribonuclease J 1 [uncultured Clostridium sp.]
MANKKQQRPKLQIIPLGGVDEIGKNMTAFVYGDDMILVDCGSMFPQEEMLGIDLVIPDITFLVKNRDKLRAILITHGHEDHIGAMPYVLRELPVPVYGTQLSLGLIENKLKEHRINNAKLNTIAAGDKISIGCFTIEFIKVCHSIAGAVALAIHTPVGTVVHTGDFKIDYTPIDGVPTDLAKFALLGKQGVLCLLGESTNVERPGSTISERKIGETFETFFRSAKGRIIVATFASNIHRIQQIIDAAKNHRRKICLSGRSMINVANMATSLGEMHIPDGMLIELDDVKRYRDDQLVIITTGSQGEAMSALVRMAMSEHRQLDIHPGDTVIISATPIPGNEKFVSRVINQLYRKGARVIYDALAEVHTSGHARQEELKLIHSLVKPKFFVPIHGEYRHLVQHAELAKSLGMRDKNVFIPECGGVLEFSRNSAQRAGEVVAGQVLVDGLGIGDVGNVVLRDRKHLSEDGLMVAVLALSKETGELISEPEIISRGFVYVKESEDLIAGARAAIESAIASTTRNTPRKEWGNVKNVVRNRLREYLYEKTKRNPMILPIVVEI